MKKQNILLLHELSWDIWREVFFTSVRNQNKDVIADRLQKIINFTSMYMNPGEKKSDKKYFIGENIE